MFTKGNIPKNKGVKIVPQKYELISCICGCGATFNKFDSRNRPRYRISGHKSSWILGHPMFFNNLKHGPLLEETKQKISRAKQGKRCSIATEFKPTLYKEMSYKRIRNRQAHRVIMEEYLERKLDCSEIVHHINGNKQDNRIENLQIVTRTEHALIHHKHICPVFQS